MTRVNIVPVKELMDQHLMAEYSELPRIAKALEKTLLSKKGWSINRVPKQYCLGTGHVLFFTNKRKYLYSRYLKLIDELYVRNYNIIPENRDINWDIFDKVPQIDWNPSNHDMELNRVRLAERIAAKPGRYRYYGKVYIANSDL